MDILTSSFGNFSQKKRPATGAKSYFVDMQKIDSYLEYRDFLRDFYEDRKLTYRSFGAMVGMDASLLAKVMLKSRHISTSAIPVFAKAMGLSEKESEYFDCMVRFCKAKNASESRHFFERLLELKSGKASKLLRSQYDYFNSWRHAVIRALLEFYDFRGDYAELAKRLSPPITPREAKESIRLLSNLGLIRCNEEGRWVQTESAVTTGEAWNSVAINNFQKETIRLAMEGIDRHKRSEMDVSTVTMTLKKEDVRVLRAMIRDFRASVIRFVNDASDPQAVYHLNLQLMPMSRLPEEE